MKPDLNNAISMLGCIKTGNKKIDGKLDKIINHLEKSRDAKNNNKAFNEGRKAVKELMKLMDKKRTPQSVKDTCRVVIEKLIEYYDSII